MRVITNKHCLSSYKALCAFLKIAPAQRGSQEKEYQLNMIAENYYLKRHANNKFTIAPLGYEAVRTAARDLEGQRKRQEKKENGSLVEHIRYSNDLNNNKKKYDNKAIEHIMLYSFQENSFNTQTSYISNFFSCVKYIRALEDLDTFYVRYSRDIVAEADIMIRNMLANRFGVSAQRLIERGKASRDIRAC